MMDNIVLSLSIGHSTRKKMRVDINDVFKEAEDQMYSQKLTKSSNFKSKTIDIIMNSLFEKDEREKLHSKRVEELCRLYGVAVGLSKEEVNQLGIAGLMHDIGKIGIDGKILNKIEKLNTVERNLINRHSEIGYRILSSSNEFSQIAELILEHHERWDGNGYPKGLEGKGISLQARIINVVDSYDAMTSNRIYCKKISDEDAIAELIRCAGTQFDPAVVGIFIEEVLNKRTKDR